VRTGRRQTGFSLVELMVALIIGLFVLAGVGSVYITGKRSYQARDGLSLLQENGRIAVQMVERVVARAGYPLFAEITPVIDDKASLEKWAAPVGLPFSLDRTGLESDTLTVAWMPYAIGEEANPDQLTESASDCLGNRPDPNAIPERTLSAFYIKDQTLMCFGSNGTRPQPLVENVVAMHVEYGEDRTGDGFADQYVRLSDVQTWKKVVSIRIAFLVSSGEDVLERPADGPQTFLLAGERVTLDRPGDKRLYRVFSSTIPLRNRMPLL